MEWDDYERKPYPVLHFNQTHFKILSEYFRSRHDMETGFWSPLCLVCVVWWCQDHSEAAGTYISVMRLCPLQYSAMFSFWKAKCTQVNKWKPGELGEKYFNLPDRKPEQMRNSDRTSSETVTLGKKRTHAVALILSLHLVMKALTSFYNVSIIAKQICPLIMLYVSVSSVNLKVLYKGREILLLLFEVDDSQFTDLVTTPHSPPRKQ